jgi:hypothetical protein
MWGTLFFVTINPSNTLYHLYVQLIAENQHEAARILEWIMGHIKQLAYLGSSQAPICTAKKEGGHI